ncbi:hypothetical protein ACJMK2_040071 [Sinanodonta woodiana]|uniref:Polymerase beta nucleotidyltransferase domain-containing protein n=1 Tax=Sinanodonta woodiana TaxID=1069815 RepID=A0ABD3WDW9_SINWO
MSQQSPEFYHHVSERISIILNLIGYSQEDRDRKVRHAIAIELLESIPWTTKSLTYFLFGSRAEGSTGNGLHSDFDILFAHNCTKIILDLSDFQPGHYNLLMVKDEWTHLGM